MGGLNGWRAKIGVIAPTIGIPLEQNFHRHVPEGVAVITTRILFDGPTPQSLLAMSELLEETAKVFKGTDVDLITFGCTSGSLIGGPQFDQECIRRIEKGSGGIPATTTSTALIRAFSLLGSKRIAVFTPYPDDTNEAEKHFLEHHGLDVLNITGVRETGSIGELTPGYIYRKIKQVGIAAADTLFISCTGIEVLELIEPLEADYGVPVLTSNQVTLWGALRGTGVNEKLPGIGKFLRNH